MSSRLAHDSRGRLVAVVTSASPGLPLGTMFVCLGNTLEAAGLGVGWLGRTGRPPTPAERSGGREPYPARAARLEQARSPQERHNVPDDELADAEAIEVARREQEHEPVDLIGGATAARANAAAAY